MSTDAVKKNVVEPVTAAAQAEIAPKPKRRYRALVFQGYVVIAIVGFGVLFFFARSVAYFPLDLQIAVLFQRLADLPVIGLPFSGLMLGVSWLGYSPQSFIIAGLIVIIMYAIGVRWEAVCALVASVGSSAFATVAKIIVHRPRPTEDLVRIIQRVGEYSFPSGHVVFYVTFFGFLLFLSFTLLKAGIRRFLLALLFGSLLLFVGPSRVFLGAHWPSDVVGAYLLGSLCLVAVIYIYRWGKTRYFVHQPVAPEAPGPKPAGTAA